MQATTTVKIYAGSVRQTEPRLAKLLGSAFAALVGWMSVLFRP